jgi:hypothetical protein
MDGLALCLPLDCSQKIKVIRRIQEYLVPMSHGYTMRWSQSLVLQKVINGTPKPAQKFLACCRHCSFMISHHIVKDPPGSRMYAC